MKKIMLVGDSIRDGYCTHVRELLNGEYEVVWNPDNSRFCSYTLFNIREWIDGCGGADCIIWNNGMWDVVHMRGADYTIVSPEEYALTLKKIIGQIRQALPSAEIIWASTTRVIEEENRRSRPDHQRFNSDIERFNGIAAKIMKEHNIPVCDLYGISAGMDDSLYLDGVHHKPECSLLLAREIVRCVKNL